MPDDERHLPSEALAAELLRGQLERMRGMLYRYSELFFVHMRVYTLVTIALLVASLWEPLGGAVLIVPFLVPFVFMEASYLFWYTVFARRHAEWVERALARGAGRGLPAAHRLEAAYFYAPDDPGIAALDLRRPTSHMSAVTLAYSAGAGLLWLAGIVLGADWIGRQDGAQPILELVPVAALVWTLAIAGYLVWTWLRRPDERRLIEALDEVYPDAVRSPGSDSSEESQT